MSYSSSKTDQWVITFPNGLDDKQLQDLAGELEAFDFPVHAKTNDKKIIVTLSKKSPSSNPVSDLMAHLRPKKILKSKLEEIAKSYEAVITPTKH